MELEINSSFSQSNINKVSITQSSIFIDLIITFIHLSIPLDTIRNYNKKLIHFFLSISERDDSHQFIYSSLFLPLHSLCTSITLFIRHHHFDCTLSTHFQDFSTFHSFPTFQNSNTSSHHHIQESINFHLIIISKRASTWHSFISISSTFLFSLT
jgi:hypothetical protein